MTGCCFAATKPCFQRDQSVWQRLYEVSLIVNENACFMRDLRCLYFQGTRPDQVTRHPSSSALHYANKVCLKVSSKPLPTNHAYSHRDQFQRQIARCLHGSWFACRPGIGTPCTKPWKGAPKCATCVIRGLLSHVLQLRIMNRATRVSVLNGLLTSSLLVL